jgi:hypothetical protein
MVERVEPSRHASSRRVRSYAVPRAR